MQFLSSVMEKFTKPGKPQNQHWDLFSVKNMMLSNLFVMVTVHLYCDYSTFQQVPLTADRGAPQSLTKM